MHATAVKRQHSEAGSVERVGLAAADDAPPLVLRSAATPAPVATCID
jgi:hypothetical protein